jgi:hypothetical protein
MSSTGGEVAPPELDPEELDDGPDGTEVEDSDGSFTGIVSSASSVAEPAGRSSPPARLESPEPAEEELEGLTAGTLEPLAGVDGSSSTTSLGPDTSLSVSPLDVVEEGPDGEEAGAASGLGVELEKGDPELPKPELPTSSESGMGAVSSPSPSGVSDTEESPVPPVAGGCCAD